MTKQRNDSCDAYQKAGREDLLNKEKEEREKNVEIEENLSYDSMEGSSFKQSQQRESYLSNSNQVGLGSTHL